MATEGYNSVLVTLTLLPLNPLVALETAYLSLLDLSHAAQ